jgi:hypothetical protein
MATTTPRLLKVSPGRYTTEDGRFVIYNGHGWYRGVWTLWDKRRDEAGDFGSKAEAAKHLAWLLAKEAAA